MDGRLAWMPFPPYSAHEQTENIQIGAIIADPFSPNQVLTTVDDSILDAFYPLIQENLELNRLFVWSVDNAPPSFWRRCWEHLSSGMSVLSAHTEKFTRYDIEAQILVTKEFPHDPRQTEIMARLANPTVDQLMNEPVRGSLGLWSRETPVYMITGLRFAKGKIVFRQVRGETIELRFRHNIADPIIRTDQNQSHSSEHLWEKDEETIVAYKLLKIEKNHQRRNDSDDELILSEVFLEGSEWY